MKKLIFALVAILSAMFAFSSCNDEIDFDNSAYFNTESFSDFLWKKQGPVKIESEIEFDFEECDGLTKPLVLCLCDDGGEKIGTDIAQLFVNDEIQPDNTIKIYPNSDENDVDIEIVLNPELTDKDRVFTWNLKVVDDGDFQRVNDVVASETPWIDGTTIQWENNHVANMLEVSTFSILALLVLAFIIAVIACRHANPPFIVKRLYWEDTSGTTHPVVLNGASKVVFTNKRQKQSFFSKIFNRKFIYVKDEFFSAGDLTIAPYKRGSEVGVKFRPSKYYNTSEAFIIKDESTTVNNEEGQEINMNV